MCINLPLVIIIVDFHERFLYICFNYIEDNLYKEAHTSWGSPESETTIQAARNTKQHNMVSFYYVKTCVIIPASMQCLIASDNISDFLEIKSSIYFSVSF